MRMDMRELNGNSEIKALNRIKVAKYMLDKKTASRQELAAQLGFSLPTVFQIVSDLIERGILCEAGEYGSTGGRKAKILTLRAGQYYTVGVELSKHHIHTVLVDLTGEEIANRRERCLFENAPAYFNRFYEVVRDFLLANGFAEEDDPRILGVGISLPGTIDPVNNMLRQSLTLNVSELSLQRLSQRLHYPVCFGQNARNAALAECCASDGNVVYISLSDTVSGGALLNGKSYTGDRFKAVLFGHMIIVPRGKKCYCGKRGCLNAYCSARNLCEESGMPLERFFSELEAGNPDCEKLWSKYLDWLSFAVANLRTIFDCKIVIGGDISQYLDKYLDQLETRVVKNIIFEHDMSFVKLGKYSREVFAIGAARLMLEASIQDSDLLRS